jgi:hypothetical protein
MLGGLETYEEVCWKERKRLRALLVSSLSSAKKPKGESEGEGERLLGKGILVHPDEDLRISRAADFPYFELFPPSLKLRLGERYMPSARVSVCAVAGGGHWLAVMVKFSELMVEVLCTQE